MKFQDITQTYYEFSGKLSDITRQLNFAGIAIIWLFSTRLSNGTVSIPILLMLGLFFFILAFLFDVSQYCYGTIIHLRKAEKLEKEFENKFGELHSKTDFYYDTKVIRPINELFKAKIWASIIAYVFLAIHVTLNLVFL